MTEHCRNCRFFAQPVNDSGYCLRYPPTVIIRGTPTLPMTDTAQPFVSGASWCGEWQDGRKTCSTCGGCGQAMIEYDTGDGKTGTCANSVGKPCPDCKGEGKV